MRGGNECLTLFDAMKRSSRTVQKLTERQQLQIAEAKQVQPSIG